MRSVRPVRRLRPRQSVRSSRPVRSLGALLAAAAVTLAGAGPVLAAGGSAQAATPLPDHVFAPYFESWTGDSPAQLSADSGATHLTMAFIQTPASGSCTPYWNGDSGSPISSGTFGSDISTIQARGGDVIPSFGGYSADTTGTEIADSCTDVGQIAAAYEKVITTYDVSRLDMDVEADSLNNSGGIDRRNKAIKEVEDWAAQNGRQVQFSYTLPTTTSGLASSGLSVLQNAVSNGARVDVANIMTFDYYDGATHDMANDTETAAQGLHDQLASLYPGTSSADLWGMVGITEMPGVDDYGPAETFSLADATQVYDWAVSQGIDTLSFWALQRDNGSCPGGSASDGCSGIQQNTWDFSHTFQPFTGGGRPPAGNDFSVATSPASGTVTAGSLASVSVKTAVTAGDAEPVSLSVGGAPQGVTASLTPTSVTAGGSSTLTLATSASAASGTFSITVTGTSGATSHSATYALTVTGGSGGQCSAAAWDAGAVYVAGDQVSYGGHLWQAKWWTTDEEPGTTGEWGVWEDLGAC